MKKFLIITLTLIIVVGLFLGGGFALGLGKGAGDGGDDASVQNLSNVEIREETKAQPEATETAAAEKKVVEVAVVEKEYFYNNQRMELEELVKILQGMEGEFVVAITDDNATLNAYEKLTDRLTELSIPYSE